MRKRLRPACTNERRSSVNMITSFPDIRKRADDFSRRITFCRRHETRNCSWLHVCSFVIHTGVITHSKKKNKRHSAVLITTTITRNEKQTKEKGRAARLSKHVPRGAFENIKFYRSGAPPYPFFFSLGRWDQAYVRKPDWNYADSASYIPRQLPHAPPPALCVPRETTIQTMTLFLISKLRWA